MQGTTPKDTPEAVHGIEGMGPEELYREGSQHFRAKDYGKARAYFERYVSIVTDDAEALHLLARACYHENVTLDRAVECINAAIRQRPEEASRYLLTLAEIYIHQADYGGAEVVLDEAARQDPGTDPKHAYAIDFYLNLVRRKNKGRPKPGGARKEEPQPYSAGSDPRYNRSGRHLFLLPSVILHVLGLLLVGYISSVDMPSRERFIEDFTFVEVGEAPEEAEFEEAPEGETARRAPAAERRAEAGPQGAVREASGTGSIGARPEFESEGPRTVSGEKTAARLEAGRSADDASGALSGAEKGMDIRARARAAEEAGIEFAPGSLGIDVEGGAQAGRVERGAKALADRRGAPKAGIKGGAKTGGGAEERSGQVGGGKQAASLGGAPARDVSQGVAAGEKSLALDSPAGRGREFPEAGFTRQAADALYISPSGGQAQADAGAHGDETFKTVEKGGARVSAKGISDASEPGRGGPSDEPGHETGKTGLGGLLSGGGGRESGLPEPAASSERRGLMASAAAGRRFEEAGSVPAPRKLGISAGADAGAGVSGRPGGDDTDSPAGIGEKRAAEAAGVSGAGRAAADFSAAGGGYSAAAGRGKGVGSGALSGGPSGEPAPGLGAVGGEKSRSVPARGGKLGSGQFVEGGPRRPGGLEGLGIGAGPHGGAGGSGEGPGGEGGGVKLGSGEKSGTAAPSGARLAGLPGGTGAKTPGSGEKKGAEGALGVPGGKGRERYDSAAGTRPAPIAPEKMPGVNIASKGGAKTGFGPTVRIISPSPGSTSELSQVVKGMVADARVGKATLTVNNDSRVVSVTEGRFESAVALSEGRNVITVMAFDRDGNVGKDSITVVYRPGAGAVPVKITEPRDGQIFDVSQSNIIKVRGTIGDTRIKKARIILNGRPKDVVVKDGRFTQEIALTQEKNTVVVEAADQDGHVSASNMVGFGTMNIKPKDIMVILTWDKPNADFDLHVTGPMGGHTSYQSPNIYVSKDAIEGGQLEQDAKGNFGPEVFTMERSEKGVYTVKSNYYYSGGDGDAHATVTVILYGDNPARKIVRVFGPHLQVDRKTGEEMWEVARFKMPEGIFLED